VLKTLRRSTRKPDRREAFQNILEQLKQLGAEEVRIDSGAHEKTVNPNLLTQDSDPEDPSVVVYFTKDGEDFAVPCDKWDNVRDNAQAIANYLDAKRALDRYGVKTVETEFTTQKLPPGEEDRQNDGGDGDEGFGDKPPHKVLGVPSGADDDEIKAAARALKKEYHPDTGGDIEKFNRVLEAEKLLLGAGG
jgi:DnaJ-domain-containing protein 1